MAEHDNEVRRIYGRQTTRLNAVIGPALLALGVTIQAGQSTATPPPLAQQSSDVLVKWLGVSPDGGLVYEDGTCSQDVDFELSHDGDVLSGWINSAHVVAGGCSPFLSQDQRTQQFVPSRIVATMTGSAVSLTVFKVRLLNGVPNQLTVVFASGTMDANQLITTGSVLGPRTWVDTNRNGFPDCDFTVPAPNDECGNAVGSRRAVVFRASRVIR